MGLSHMQLQNLSQKSCEYFKEYAHLWRELATHVQPPLLDREQVEMFMGTLQGYYLENLIGSVSLSFSNLLMVGEHIESSLESGKIQGALSGQIGESESSSDSQEENEDRIDAIMKFIKLRKLSL